MIEEPCHSHPDSVLREFTAADRESGAQLERAIYSLTPELLCGAHTPRQALIALFYYSRSNGIVFSTGMMSVVRAALEARGSFWAMMVEIRDGGSDHSEDSLE